jgi:hypothetical protein
MIERDEKPRVKKPLSQDQLAALWRSMDILKTQKNPLKH